MLYWWWTQTLVVMATGEKQLGLATEETEGGLVNMLTTGVSFRGMCKK